jgi:integrase
MSRVVLTDAKCVALKPGPRRRFIADALCPGLILQITPQGHRSFMLRAMFPGGRNRVRRLLGEVGAISIDDARSTARQWIALLAQGRDPQLELAEQRRSTVAEAALTFGVVADAYIHARLRNTRQGARGAKEIRSELAQWNNRPITAISRADVIRLVEAVRARGQRTAGSRASGSHARTVLSHCRSIFDWATLRYDLERSPCDRLRPKDLGLVFKPRIRVLDDDEIRRLWRACDTMGAPFGPFIKTLLLTGCRRSEISNCKWSEVDLAAKVIVVPRERAKADAEHRIPITDDLATLLATLPRFHSGDFIFTTTYGRRPISGFSKATRRLHHLMDNPLSFSIHDIRRTFRSKLSELGIAERVAEMAISHGPRNPLVRIYDRHGFEAEIRSANERWHRRLCDIISPAPANVNVVPLLRA